MDCDDASSVEPLRVEAAAKIIHELRIAIDGDDRQMRLPGEFLDEPPSADA